MAKATVQTRRQPGKLTENEQEALVNLDRCAVCSKRRVFRRPWREDWYCGGCRSVFLMIGRAIHYVGNQRFLK